MLWTSGGELKNRLNISLFCRQMQHYKILGIAPTASLSEIKRAYRKLVHLYHPDKAENKESETQFLAVQKAYEVLSNTAKRQIYDINYYTSKNGEPENLIQPADLLKKLIVLERKLHGQDPYRMNKDNLYFELSYFLGSDSIELIKKETELVETYLSLALKCLEFLTFKIQKTFLTNLLSNFSEKKYTTTIDQYFKKQQLLFYWNKYKFLLVLIFVIGVCWWVNRSLL